MSNYWEDWAQIETETGRNYARNWWVGKAQHQLRRIARAFRLPLRIVAAVPPVPAKAAHRRRFGRG